MNILVSGSLAYDRIMDFPGNFADHIVAEKAHVINISFTVSGMVEKLGGTAGNIAYALALLGEEPLILATIGQDYGRYFQWLERNNISHKAIRIIEEEFTAGAFITTDQANNQITGFNPGAMKHQSRFDVERGDPQQTIAIIAPGNTQDMVDYARAYKGQGIPYIFDPGQQIPVLSAEDLLEGLHGSKLLIANDYEMELILHKAGLDLSRILEMTEAVITTKGEHGSTVLGREGETSVAAVPAAQIVDPTGAGDAYRGALIKGLIEGRDLATCAMMGSVCASFAVERYGTQEYRFTTPEFWERFEQHFGQVKA